MWTVAAFFALVAAGGMAATAGVVNHLDDQRREGGYLTTDRTQVGSRGHAVIFDEIDLDGLDGDWLLGTARLRATSTQPDSPVFIGVAPSSDVETYLRGAGYSTVDEFDDGDVTYVEHTGGPPAVAPADSDIWTAQASGTGTQTIDVEARGRQLDGRDDERRRVIRRRRAGRRGRHRARPPPSGALAGRRQRRVGEQPVSWCWSSW